MLKETFLDPEFFVDKDSVYLIEVNVRMGGFRHDLALPAFQIDLNKMVAELALGQEIDDELKVIGSASACEIWETRSGVIKKLRMPKSKYYSVPQNLLNGLRSKIYAKWSTQSVSTNTQSEGSF